MIGSHQPDDVVDTIDEVREGRNVLAAPTGHFSSSRATSTSFFSDEIVDFGGVSPVDERLQSHDARAALSSSVPLGIILPAHLLG